MSDPKASVEFVTFWGLHARQVFSYVYSLVGNRNDADDVFQETCITLIEKFEDFDPATSFSAWACRVAYFKSLNHLQSRRSHAHLDAEVLEAIDGTLRRSVLEDDFRFEALAECLSQLPAKDRDIIDLRYRKELPVEAVARKIGRTASAVYKSLSRIHTSLRECVRHRLGGRARS